MAKKPKPGDLIEISRGMYKHWALYVGDGDVIHLASLSMYATKAVFCSVGSVREDEAKVKREKLEDVVGQDKYHINNLLDDQRKPRPIEDILKDAQSLVGEILKYNVLGNNCEHFVTLLRYGKPESRQVEAAAVVSVSALLAALVAFGFSIMK